MTGPVLLWIVLATLYLFGLLSPAWRWDGALPALVMVSLLIAVMAWGSWKERRRLDEWRKQRGYPPGSNVFPG